MYYLSRQYPKNSIYARWLRSFCFVWKGLNEFEYIGIIRMLIITYTDLSFSIGFIKVLSPCDLKLKIEQTVW